MRRWRIALAAGLLAAGLPAMTQAVVFTFVATPLTVSAGDVTVFTFTFTDAAPSQRVGCTEVLFPDEFWISSLGSPVTSSGEDWSIGRLGQWVLVYSNDGAGRLQTGESVTFTVTALATTPGVYILDNHVHTREDCTGTNLTGTMTPLTVLPGATSTPSPTPVPTPVPTDTPTPSPKHTPDPPPRPTPDRSTPSPTETAIATPTPTPTDRPPAPAPSASPPPSGGAQAIGVAPLGGGGDGEATSDLGVGVDVLGLLDSPFEWFVPGAAVGVPGLLVILFVGLQAVGAVAWIPAVRRMGDDDHRRRHRRRPAR